MDSNSNPITNANPGMPAIPSSPAPAPVVPTPSDAMPTIPTPVDNTVPPEPATSSVPTFNPAAQAAPAAPTVSSTPTSFGMNSSYDTGYNAGATSVNGNNGGFDPSSVASFFTPETPSFSNGGIIAATEPIIEPDPIPEPDPEEVELNSPFQAAAPVPGSIGSAVSVPKEAAAPAPEETPAPAPEPAPVTDDINQMDLNSTAVSSEPVVNPNNPFLAQSAAAETTPITAEAPTIAEAPVAPEAVATPEAQPIPDMQAVPAPEIPQFDPNSPLPMPGDVMGDPMQNGAQNAMMNPIQDPNMPADGMPFAFDSANNQMNPFAEAAAMNADPNAAIGGPVKAKNNKKLIIIGAAAAAVVLIIVLVVVMMGGNKSTVSNSGNTGTNPTPTPTPTPSVPTSGTAICKRNHTADEAAKYGGYKKGSISATIVYEDEEVTKISIAETVEFEDESYRKAGVRAMNNNFAAEKENYNIADDSAMTTEVSKNGAIITGTRTISSTTNIDTGVAKLFGLVSTDGAYSAEDTMANYEEKEFTCSDGESAVPNTDYYDDDLDNPDNVEEFIRGDDDSDLNDLYYDEEES